MSVYPHEITSFIEELQPGQAMAIEACPGAGALSLVSELAHARADRGVVVIDVGGTSAPHAWAHPQIYVVVPSTARDGWLALDLVLRSGAFGLVVSLDLPRDPQLSPRYASRIRGALAKSPSSLWLVGEESAFSVPRRMRIATEAIEWTRGPLGDAPHARSFAVDVGGGPVVTTPVRTRCVHSPAHPSHRRAPPEGRSIRRASGS